MSTPSASTVSVRRATDADLATLKSYDPRPQLDLPSKRLQEQQAGTGIFAVAEMNGQVVGSAFLDFVDEELQPELKNLFVAAEARRHGVATQLWDWLEEQAADAGYQTVFLSVDPNNFRAIPMFLNLGYSPTGNHVVVENPDKTQVAEGDKASGHYAIYSKSLLAG